MMPRDFREHWRRLASAVLVKHARDAFVSDAVIASQWKPLNFSAPPDFSRALAEYDRFLEIVAGSGCEIVRLPQGSGLTLDSIYTRDASVVSADGVILASMGKSARAAGARGAGAEELRRRGVAHRRSDCRAGPTRRRRRRVARSDRRWPWAWAPARTTKAFDNSERCWSDSFDERHRGAAAGLSRAARCDAPDVVDQPRRPRSGGRLFPACCLPASGKHCCDRGYRFVDVPDDEFETMGTNVLALGPRECLMLNGNPKTRAALEKAGARVHVYDGQEISLKGGGGPTCLTRPLARLA